MQICYVENLRLPTEKAHGYQIMKTCEAWAKLGVKPSVIAAKRSHPLQFQDIFAYYQLVERFPISFLPVIDLMYRAPVWLDSIAYQVEYTSFLLSVWWQVVRRKEADIFYTRDMRVASLLFRQEKPVVVELHTDPNLTEQRWRRAIEGVSAWIVISHALEQFLIAKGVDPKRICCAPDGFDATEFQLLPERQQARQMLGIPSEKTLVVYTGQLFPWKGLDGIAEAFSHLPEGMQLAIIGGDELDRERLKKKAGLFTAEQAMFYPRVAHHEVLTWLAAADFALLPTSALFSIGRSYTSPIKLFEYLAAGLPLIASDVPSTREIIDEEVGFFFTADSGSSFLKAIERAAQMSPIKRQEMEKKARIRAQGYSWHERGETILRFLREVTSKKF